MFVHKKCSLQAPTCLGTWKRSPYNRKQNQNSVDVLIFPFRMVGQSVWDCQLLVRWVVGRFVFRSWVALKEEAIFIIRSYNRKSFGDVLPWVMFYQNVDSRRSLPIQLAVKCCQIWLRVFRLWVAVSCLGCYIPESRWQLKLKCKHKNVKRAEEEIFTCSG